MFLAETGKKILSSIIVKAHKVRPKTVSQYYNPFLSFAVLLTVIA